MTDGGGEVLVQVCLECGHEYMFEDETPPDDLRCDRCGNGVFRSFRAPTGDNEAARDFEDTTARDTHPDDPEGDVTAGDLRDLDRL